MAPNTEFTRAQSVPGDATFDPSNIKGKSVIVTGGASGLGEQFVRSFVQVGAFVTFGDLAVDRGEQLLADLGTDKVAFVPCNVLTWADQLLLFKTAMAKSPSNTIDIVIANAGISGLDDVYLHDETPDGDPVEPALNILKINLVGVFYSVKLALFYLPKQPEGADRDRCILMTASMSGYGDQAGSPQYNSSKWGVRGLMRSIRRTGPNQNIRVNIIAPWFVDTRIMSEQVKEKVKSAGIEFCDLEDAGPLALHFASDMSLNGRAFALLPKSSNSRGYLDLQLDDLNEEDFMTGFQNAGTRSAFRMGSK